MKANDFSDLISTIANGLGSLDLSALKPYIIPGSKKERAFNALSKERLLFCSGWEKYEKILTGAPAHAVEAAANANWVHACHSYSLSIKDFRASGIHGIRKVEEKIQLGRLEAMDEIVREVASALEFPFYSSCYESGIIALAGDFLRESSVILNAHNPSIFEVYIDVVWKQFFWSKAAVNVA